VFQKIFVLFELFVFKRNIHSCSKEKYSFVLRDSCVQKIFVKFVFSIQDSI